MASADTAGFDRRVLEQQEAEEREREERRERKKAKKVFFSPPHLPPCCHASCKVAGHSPLVSFTGWSPSPSEATAARMIHKFVGYDPGTDVFVLELAQAANAEVLNCKSLLNTARLGQSEATGRKDTCKVCDWLPGH